MKHTCLILMLCLMQSCTSDGAAPPVGATNPLPSCEPTQLLGRVPTREEAQVHRQFTLPTIDYPAGTHKDVWGLSVTLRVDATGVPVCHARSEPFKDEAPLDGPRRALLGGLADWRYAPLVRDGRTVPMIVTESLREQELPGVRVPMPSVPLSQVRIVLARSGCFGACPAYSVEIRGDGSVLYDGRAFVDVEGEHRYQVPVEDVAALIESARAKDLWSMRTSYRARITDNPTYELVLDMGGKMHRIEDYVGGIAGMPLAVSEFEEEVDRVARSAMWLTLSGETIDQLQREGFVFDSQEGADLLARAVANRHGSGDEAMARLVALGAPIEGAKLDAWMREGMEPLIEDALRRRRVALIDPLIAAGALETGGRRDEEKINEAFRAAIQGGNLQAVQAVWEAAGARHPVLTFMDEGETPDDKPVRKRVPVTLLLSGAYQPRQEWQGLAVARWLVAQGCDIKASGADGDTLLHIAAAANDTAFVRYLLDQGLDASAVGEYGLPPLASVHDEDVALMLLEAGTDVRMMDDGGGRFLSYARDNHWGRVVAWLERYQAKDHRRN